MPSPASGGYRPGDMALLGLVMAALLLLCLIVIGFLLSRLLTGKELQICQCPCFPGPQSHSHRDSLQFTNDGFQTEADSRGRWGVFPRSKVLPMGRRSPKPCSSCGTFSNHVSRTSPMSRRSREHRNGSEPGLTRPKRKEGQKSVWFKESEDSSEIEVEIIPDTAILDETEETQEEDESKQEVEVVRDPKAPQPNQMDSETEKKSEE